MDQNVPPGVLGGSSSCPGRQSSQIPARALCAHSLTRNVRDGHGSSCSCWVFLPQSCGSPKIHWGDEGSTWIPVYLPGAGQGQPWGSFGRHWSGAGALCRGNWAWKMRDSGWFRGEEGGAAAGGAEGSRVSPGEVTSCQRGVGCILGCPHSSLGELPAPLLFLPVCPGATLDPGAAGSGGAAAS